MREEGLIIIDDSSRTHTITMPGDPKTAFAKAMERLEELSREWDQQKAKWEAEIEEKTAKTTVAE